VAKPFDETARWTDTWVKMPSGKWQCVADQDSPPPTQRKEIPGEVRPFHGPDFTLYSSSSGS